MSDLQEGFVDSLVTAARENPLSAALIGGGALWLLIGSEKLKSAAGLASASTFSSGDTEARSRRSVRSRYEATPAPPTAPEMDHDEPFGLGDNLRHATGGVSNAVSKAAGRIEDGVDEGTAYVRDNLSKLGETLPGKETFAHAQSSLADLLDRQPLLLGAIGLVVGAAVAGAFPASDVENELVGDYSDRVKERLVERAEDVSQRGREAADSLKSGIKNASSETLGRVKQAGIEAPAARGQTVKTRD